jgi:DNA-binding NarL/FixJ family response regulator
MNEKRIILLVTRRMTDLDPFVRALQDDETVTLIQVPDHETAILQSGRIKPALAVIDGSMGDASALDLARRLLTVSAFIHTVILSDMDENLFHDQSEGLGVLAHFPSTPEPGHAQQLLLQLKDVMGGV